MIPLAAVAGVVVFWLLLSVKVLNEYERGVVFRLGKVLPRPKGPGLIIVAWPVDRMVRVSLRTVVMGEGASRDARGMTCVRRGPDRSRDGGGAQLA